MKKRARVLPVIDETLEVSKRTVDRGGVRVTKRVSHREERVEVPVTHDEVDVRRVPRGVWLDAPARVRQQGDTLVIPVMEEVVVTETRLRLREEIHVRRSTVRTTVTKKVKLRREDVSVEKVPPKKR